MSVHGNGEAGKSGQAEETDIYATQGDAEDLAWMEPVYRKFDEQRSILAEQKIALLKEAKRAEVHRVLVEEKLSDMCVRLDQLESSTNGLEKRLTALEGRTRMWESLEERSQTVLTELVTEMSREIQQQIKQDMELFERDLEKQRRDLHLLKSVYAHADVSKSAVQVKQSSHDTPAGTSQETPAESRRRLPSLPRSNSTTLRDRVVPETARPVQRPGTYSGDSLWESYYAQFEITAELNGWNEQQKAAYLATSLTGQALNVLGNLPADRRQNYKELVAALETRYGSTHRTELARVRFKHRVKQKDESLAAMAEDLERLGRLAYPDAPGNLQNVLSRDQFVDALPDPDMRLRVKQERPPSLQRALELALELESFQLASNQRQYRVARETKLADNRKGQEKTPRKASEEEKEFQPLHTVLERLERSLRECVSDVRAAVNWRKRQQGNKGRSGCWRCGRQGHLRRDCPHNTPPRSPKKSKNEDGEPADEQRKSPLSNSGNGKKLMLGGERQQKR